MEVGRVLFKTKGNSVEEGNSVDFGGCRTLHKNKLCLIFKLAPSVCRMTFPIIASLLVRLAVLLPFQLILLSLATPSRRKKSAYAVFVCRVFGCLLFLFQAEDGIRDHCVTGVQTCALPI